MNLFDEISEWYFYWFFSSNFQLAYSSLNPAKKRITYTRLRAARDRIKQVTPLEAMMIEALQTRYQSPTPVPEAEYHR